MKELNGGFVICKESAATELTQVDRTKESESRSRRVMEESILVRYGESVLVSLRENYQEVHALFPYRRRVGSVGGVNAGVKSLELVQFKSPSNGFEFKRGYRLSIAVRELGKAHENPVLEIMN